MQKQINKKLKKFDQRKINTIDMFSRIFRGLEVEYKINI